MSLPIFGAGPGRKPLISGSSTPREKRMDDIKLSSRKAKSNMESIPIRNDRRKKIVGRATV